MSTSSTFDVYGLPIRVSGDWDEIVEFARLDFAWFETRVPVSGPVVEVRIARRRPDLDAFGAVPAAFVSPRYAVFKDGAQTIVDYRGLAAAVLRRDGDELTIQGEDRDAVHEAVYYCLLGRIGRHLDQRGLVRIHALGLSGDDGGVLVLLPSSGGKSTLAMKAVEHRHGRLLSEDSPLLDHAGRLHPFPLRVAVAAAPSATASSARPLPNPAAGLKQAVEVEMFADRIETTPTPLRHIVIGTRSLGREARLEARTRSAAALPLLVHGVVGVGLYQGLGYAHQRGLTDFTAKLLTAATRASACARVLRHAQVWSLTLGRDREQCWSALRQLL